MAGGCTPSKEGGGGAGERDADLKGKNTGADSNKKHSASPRSGAASSSSSTLPAETPTHKKMSSSSSATTKVAIVFHSFYGHIYALAQAIAEGAKTIEGVEVDLYQVPETLPAEVLGKMGALETKKGFEHVPVIENPSVLGDYDAIVFGTPTRFGNMSGQMKAFIDHLGQLWASDKLVGKVGSVFTSSNTQHGGQETTIITTLVPLLHLGLTIVGVPYSCKTLFDTSEMNGGSPYGASTIASGDGSRQPSEKELDVAKFQGTHVAKTAAALKKGSQ